MIARRTARLLIAASAFAACAPPARDVPGTGSASPAATSEIELPPAPSSDLAPTPPAPGRPSMERPQSSAWLTSERDAVQLARESKEPLVINFFAEWCMACKRHDEITFADPVVRARLARFVKLRVDATDDEDVTVSALMVKYRIEGLPTILLFDSTGTRQGDITQFVGPEAFVGKLDAVH